MLKPVGIVSHAVGVQTIIVLKYFQILSKLFPDSFQTLSKLFPNSFQTLSKLFQTLSKLFQTLSKLFRNSFQTLTNSFQTLSKLFPSYHHFYCIWIHLFRLFFFVDASFRSDFRSIILHKFNCSPSMDNSWPKLGHRPRVFNTSK